jgi:hypothetical protein
MNLQRDVIVRDAVRLGQKTAVVPKRLRATRHAVTGSRYEAFDATQRLDVPKMRPSRFSVKDQTRTVELLLAVAENCASAWPRDVRAAQ